MQIKSIVAAVTLYLSDLEAVKGRSGFAASEIRNDLELDASGVIQLHTVIFDLPSGGRAEIILLAYDVLPCLSAVG